ncbi:MAG: GNAT family N-acetyltransferase, partial [Nocardioides sp.]
EGYTEYLGVVPSAQGRGLGRVLLDQSAVLFADRGHPYATLAFDTGNPTSAGRLYESVGYEKQHTTVFHAIDA